MVHTFCTSIFVLVLLHAPHVLLRVNVACHGSSGVSALLSCGDCRLVVVSWSVAIPCRVLSIHRFTLSPLFFSSPLLAVLGFELAAFPSFCSLRSRVAKCGE